MTLLKRLALAVLALSATAPAHAADQASAPAVLRYLLVQTSNWPDANNPDLSDLYTRIEVYSCWDSSGNVAAGGARPLSDSSCKDDASEHRDYSREERNWLARLLTSRTRTVTAVANLEIRDPSLKAAIPLFSISQASGPGLGNVWTTNYTASNLESPLFRMGANSALIVHVNTKVSSDLKSQAASTVLGAVTRAVQIAAPTSTLLTTLSKADVANTATAIDTAVSSLFSQDITEDVELGRFARSWTPSASFSLTGCAPFVRTQPAGADGGVKNGCYDGGADFDNVADVPVGTWIVRLQCPRPSAFSADDICDRDASGHITGAVFDGVKIKAAQVDIAKAVSDAQILEFSLSSQVSIQTFVTSQDWYDSFLKKTAPVEADTSLFCSNALTALYANGLNRFDAALTLRAMIRQIPALVSDTKAFFDAKAPTATCKRLLKFANVDPTFDKSG